MRITTLKFLIRATFWDLSWLGALLGARRSRSRASGATSTAPEVFAGDFGDNRAFTGERSRERAEVKRNCCVPRGERRGRPSGRDIVTTHNLVSAMFLRSSFGDFVLYGCRRAASRFLSFCARNLASGRATSKYLRWVQPRDGERERHERKSRAGTSTGLQPCGALFIHPGGDRSRFA